MEPVALTADQLAEQLGIKPTTLQEWRTRGTGPQYRIVGRRVIYLSQSVRDWIESQPDRHYKHGIAV